MRDRGERVDDPLPYGRCHECDKEFRAETVDTVLKRLRRHVYLRHPGKRVKVSHTKGAPVRYTKGDDGVWRPDDGEAVG